MTIETLNQAAEASFEVLRNIPEEFTSSTIDDVEAIAEKPDQFKQDIQALFTALSGLNSGPKSKGSREIRIGDDNFQVISNWFDNIFLLKDQIRHHEDAAQESDHRVMHNAAVTALSSAQESLINLMKDMIREFSFSTQQLSEAISAGIRDIARRSNAIMPRFVAGGLKANLDTVLSPES